LTTAQIVARRRASGSAEPLLDLSPASVACPRTLSPEAGANARLAVFGFAQAHDSAGGAEQNIHQDRVSVFRAATDVKDGTLQVVASDPFDAAMMNAVRFDARMRCSSRSRRRLKSKRR